MKYALVSTQDCRLYADKGTAEGKTNTSGIVDEIFSGWAVMFDPDDIKDGWVKITTHNNYSGYVSWSDLCEITRDELEAYQDKTKFKRIGSRFADIYDAPRVAGQYIGYALKNSIVCVLDTEKDAMDEGWTKIQTAGGTRGYIHTVFLKERLDDDGFLLGIPILEQSGNKYLEDEETFRSKLVKSAMDYLGTQYRWGGKSSEGVDCSGLVGMSYMENGYIIYRDASIKEGFPVREIGIEEAKPGDLLFFPGHVAMYLGDGRYIHSTGKKETPGVTINSLVPGDELYREDLDEMLTSAGTVF